MSGAKTIQFSETLFHFQPRHITRIFLEIKMCWVINCVSAARRRFFQNGGGVIGGGVIGMRSRDFAN